MIFTLSSFACLNLKNSLHLSMQFYNILTKHCGVLAIICRVIWNNISNFENLNRYAVGHKIQNPNRNKTLIQTQEGLAMTIYFF